MTRDARLVDALSGTGEAREAALVALREAVETERDPARRQATRCVLASASRIALARGDERLAGRLQALGGSCEGPWLFTAGAAEITAEIDAERVVCRSRTSTPPLAADVERYLSEAGPQPTGPGIEGKLRVASLERAADGVLQVELSPTTWELARGFQLALLRREESLATQRPTWPWIDAACAGRPAVPGLAAVHAIVVTSDRKLVLLRRGEGVSYKPGHWSATFEEQIVPADLDGDATLARALARGLSEECGVSSRPRIRHLPPILELDSLNIAFPALLELPDASPTFALSLARARNRSEVAGVTFLDLDRPLDLHPLHPAAPIRRRSLERYLRRAP